MKSSIGSVSFLCSLIESLQSDILTKVSLYILSDVYSTSPSNVTILLVEEDFIEFNQVLLQ